MLLNIAPPPNSTMPQEAMDIYAGEKNVLFAPFIY
eukprot:COSAG06_NODE_16314_length_1007_cov_39.558770_1_plen_34_part_10